MTPGFRHKLDIQIRFSDIDMMKHINNACYFNYVEIARLDYYGQVFGFDDEWYKQQGLIMARFEIDYKKAISFGNTVSAYTKCSRLGTSSFDLAWKITIKTATEEDIAAEGKTVIVCYDYHTKRSMQIPKEKRTLLERFEASV